MRSRHCAHRRLKTLASRSCSRSWPRPRQTVPARVWNYASRCVKGCLSRSVEQGVYRIAQETLENVVRHSGASMIAVELREVDGRLDLEIQDDGQGIDAESVEEAAEGRLGIRGMRGVPHSLAARLTSGAQPDRECASS